MYQNQIKKLRISKGMTLEKLSEMTGISIGYLCHLENRTRKNPSIEIMDRISAALDKSITDVFLNKL